MSKLALIRDRQFQQHITPELHPESPQRLAAIDKELEKRQLEAERLAPREALQEDLLLVHKSSYIDELETKAERAMKDDIILPLDADTFMSPKSFETAKLAAGAGLVGVESVLKKDYASAFIAVRPPGHHALADQAMGFCLFNNVAVAAKYAQKQLGAKRVFIIDWDVHHGNGTQDMFFADPSVCFVSFHQYPFWPPDSGWYTEDGTGEGKGFNINIPLPQGTGDRGYLKAWDTIVKPICLEYKPDLILLSAGYDAHQADPLGQQRISTVGYAMLAQRLQDLSVGTGAKVVCFLEGGYNTKSLSEAAVATMRVLSADTPEATAQVHVSYMVPGTTSGTDPVTNDQSVNEVDKRVADIKAHFAKYWKSLR